MEAHGKDMFGLTALHKFAAWDDVALLDALLPRLAAADLVAPGAPPDAATPLHACVEMDSARALERLLADPRLDADAPDARGNPARALAAQKAPHLVRLFSAARRG